MGGLEQWQQGVGEECQLSGYGVGSSLNEDIITRKWGIEYWAGVKRRCHSRGCWSRPLSATLCHCPFCHWPSLPLWSSFLSKTRWPLRSPPSLAFPNFVICHHVWREGGISGSGICLILFGAHVVRSLKIHQMWKSTPSSCLPGQLQMGTIHSCPTEMPSEHMRLLCFSNHYSGQGDRRTLKSQPRSSDQARFFTCEPIVISTQMTGLTISCLLPSVMGSGRGRGLLLNNSSGSSYIWVFSWNLYETRTSWWRMWDLGPV